MLRRLIVSSLALGAAFTPAVVAGQTAERDKICRDVERAPAVGTWASYNWVGGQSDGSTMRFAVIGREPREGKPHYWFELILENPQRGAQGKVIMQMLTPGLGAQASGIRSVVMKTGDQPAMRIPEQMVRMMAANMGSNLATEMARSCQEMEVIGWEQVTVPGGSFRALHLRHARNGMDAWVQSDLNFGMIKATMKDGSTMALSGQGTGAKSSITETPRDMPGFPGAPPP